MTSSRSILHVDMDAFFAAIEIRDQPELAGKPVLVGGIGKRGVVATASYEARRYGCRSAQPMSQALRRCPQAIVLPGRYQVYTQVSKQVLAIFRQFSPRVEALSIDEAFLDLTGTSRLFGPPLQVAHLLKSQVLRETGLTCSVGLATRKFLAKIASELNKPNGLKEIPAGEELSFLRTLPIEKLWGVGPRMREKMQAQAITTVGDLWQFSEEQLRHAWGAHGSHLYRLSRAIDDREVNTSRQAKSVGHEDTYAYDLHDRKTICQHLLAQATKVADRLHRKNVQGKCISLKIRDTHFHTETRQCTLDTPTQEARVIYRCLCSLLDSIELTERSFRLTGVSVSDLQSTTPQLELFSDHQQQKNQNLQHVLSTVRARYGHHSLYLAEASQQMRRDR